MPSDQRWSEGVSGTILWHKCCRLLLKIKNVILRHLKNHYAIATALYGGDCQDPSKPRKMTWSVVRGTNKDDMTVDAQIGVHTRILSPERDRIDIAVQEFLYVVQGVVELQRASGVSAPVPVVYGSSVEIIAKDMVASLIQNFRTELSAVARLSDPAELPNLLRASPGVTEQQIHKEAFKIVLRKLMENRTSPGNLQYEIRDYACAGGAADWDAPPGAIVLSGEDVRERTMMVQQIIPRELRERFDRTFASLLQQRDDLRPELEEIVREIAKIYATYGMVMRDEHGAVLNRFISAATTPTLTADSDVRNFIFLDAGLRRVYAEAFMKYHGIRHNVCFKTAMDKPNPPFADIAGTFLADQFDERDGTRPTAVMVKRAS